MDSAVRRQLVFDDLRSVMREVESLQAGGYTKAGEWNLAQTCAHLADWMTFPVSGYPAVPLPLRPVVWLYRATSGRRQLDEVLRGASLSSGQRTVPSTVHPASADESAEVGRLRDAIERFGLHEGRLHPSPMFGQLDGDTHLRLQLGHCAHHLSFLTPSV